MIFAVLVALGGCAGMQRASSTPDIYVMRHLQTPAGVSDPNLTGEGQRVASLLANWFKRGKPAVIYVSNTKRAQQTAAPLARKLKIKPTIYNPKNTAALIAAVSRETRTVLVVGHSNTVPDIIDGFGGQRPAPLVHEDFGDIWRIDGRSRVTESFKITD
jgi:broad specificity phosphatase PhoE